MPPLFIPSFASVVFSWWRILKSIVTRSLCAPRTVRGRYQRLLPSQKRAKASWCPLEHQVVGLFVWASRCRDLSLRGEALPSRRPTAVSTTHQSRRGVDGRQAPDGAAVAPRVCVEAGVPFIHLLPLFRSQKTVTAF